MTRRHSQSRAEIKVVLSSSQGYGGDLIVGVLYDPAGIITDRLQLVNRETPSFLDKLDKKGSRKQTAREYCPQPELKRRYLRKGCGIHFVNGVEDRQKSCSFPAPW